jgi:hypothetical protein
MGGRFYMSENSNGKGLTGDTYSGALSATTGNILTALTAKKEVTFNTNEDGKAVFTIVDTGEPADQYACVEYQGTVFASNEASGTNWG